MPILVYRNYSPKWLQVESKTTRCGLNGTGGTNEKSPSSNWASLSGTDSHCERAARPDEAIGVNVLRCSIDVQSALHLVQSFRHTCI